MKKCQSKSPGLLTVCYFQKDLKRGEHSYRKNILRKEDSEGGVVNILRMSCKNERNYFHCFKHAYGDRMLINKIRVLRGF